MSLPGADSQLDSDRYNVDFPTSYEELPLPAKTFIPNEDFIKDRQNQVAHLDPRDPMRMNWDAFYQRRELLLKDPNNKGTWVITKLSTNSHMQDLNIIVFEEKASVKPEEIGQKYQDCAIIYRVGEEEKWPQYDPRKISYSRLFCTLRLASLFVVEIDVTVARLGHRMLFLVDSGATHTEIDFDIFEQMVTFVKSSPDARQRYRHGCTSQIITANGSKDSVWHEMDLLIGGTYFPYVPIVRGDRRQDQVQGIMGLDILRHGVLVVSGDELTFTIHAEHIRERVFQYTRGNQNK